MFGLPKERVEYIALVAEIVGGLGVIISVVNGNQKLTHLIPETAK